MPHENKKINKFISAINKDAETRRRRIEAEVEKFNETELEKAKNEALHEAYRLIQRERVRTRNKISVEYSQKETAQRRELIDKRNKITESVFDDARKKLTDFTGTPEYKTWLKDKISEGLKIISGDDTQLRLCRRDVSLSTELEKTVGSLAEIVPDDEIGIGGYKLVSISKGKIIDDTLESRLMENYNYFLESSGLTIR